VRRFGWSTSWTSTLHASRPLIASTQPLTRFDDAGEHLAIVAANSDGNRPASGQPTLSALY
jgi:hypothetical protein